MFALSHSSKTPSQKTFALQPSLPRLPVPDLAASVDRYLLSLVPILQDRFSRGQLDAPSVEAALEQRRQWGKKLLQEGGLGQALQERLKDLDRSVPDNWLDDAFWLKAAYHSWRVPLPVNSNWWILMAHDLDIPKEVVEGSLPPKGTFTDWQVRRAARLTWRFLDFKDRLDRQDILPDSSRAGPFCMHQYARLYTITRIPSLPTDYITRPQPSSTHIVVSARSQLYTLQVLSPDTGAPISSTEIERGLWAILHDVENGKDVQPPVGILTAGERDAWAVARERLLSLSTLNRASLTAIEDALFAVCLDDSTRPPPTGSSDPLDGHIITASANGDGSNRWFDKSFSVIVESNSRGSLLGEHSPCDALIPSIVSDYAQASGVGQGPCDPKVREKDQGGWSKVRWVVDGEVERAMENARETAKRIQDDSDGKVLWFDEYGVDWIKTTCKQSPDAYIQMAMQLAWYRQMGWATPTYETASTRLFRKGRTDVIRTLSEASYKWVKSMDDPSYNAQTRFNLLTLATQRHNALTRDSSVGKGFDRHFLGLKLVHRPSSSPRDKTGDGPLPDLLRDPLFEESQSWELSTSGLSAGDRFLGTGFGTVWPTGYGINYLAGGKIIKFGIESKRSAPKTSTEGFRLEITMALRDMRVVCEQGQRDTSSAIRGAAEAKL